MSSLLADIGYAFRQLRRNAAFSFFIIATLAIGIGANVSMFSAVYTLLLRPLPYEGSERLVQLSGRYEGRGDRWSVSLPNAKDWAALNRSFDHVAYVAGTSFTIAGDGTPERVPGFATSPNLFQMLGARPFVGREFVVEEASPDAERVAVLSYGVWQRRYGGDASIIGETVTLSGSQYTIIGIMPQGFSFPYPGTELWIPLRADETTWQRSAGGLQVFARMRPGVSIEQARTDMDAVSARLAEEHPGVNADLSAAIRPFRQAIYGLDNVNTVLFTMLAAVGVVLLIACVNVANLLLARATSREREVGVRTAMGARRGRLIRQFLTESLLLALFGGAGGVLLALWGTDLLASVIPPGTPLPRDFPVDGAALAFAAGVTLLTGIFFGVAPALQASRADLTSMFGTRTSASGRRHSRRRDMLVVAEVALAAVLLVSAGLMLRSMLGMLAQEPGFDARNAITLRVTLDATYGDAEATDRYRAGTLQLLQDLPGVEAAAAVDFLPLAGTSNYNDFYIEGEDGNRNAGNVIATPGYFAAMGIPLLRGRDFDSRDTREGAQVVIISREMAERYWPGEDPLGRRIALGYEMGESPVWRTIVGISGGVRHGGLDSESRAEFYVPFTQVPWSTRNMTFVLRTGGDPLALVEPARTAIWSVDSNQPVFDVRTLHRVVRESGAVFVSRIIAGALMIFGGVALLLAVIGLYGVISYNVAQRTYEFGVRAALGAERQDLLRMVMKRGAALVGIGLGLGFAGALGIGRVLESMLFGVGARDPLTFAGVAAALFGVALLATMLPGLRAARVDPTQALRRE
jgi:putative ABC transport system permease protein